MRYGNFRGAQISWNQEKEIALKLDKIASESYEITEKPRDISLNHHKSAGISRNHFELYSKSVEIFQKDTQTEIMWNHKIMESLVPSNPFKMTKNLLDLTQFFNDVWSFSFQFRKVQLESDKMFQALNFFIIFHRAWKTLKWHFLLGVNPGCLVSFFMNRFIYSIHPTPLV